MFSGLGFTFDIAISLMPKFFVYYWYICCAPAFLGLFITLYKHKVRYIFYGLLWSAPVTFIGSLIFVLTKEHLFG